MIFKNINAVFPSAFIFLIFFFLSFCRIRFALLNVLFRFFWIVLNVLVQQVNVTEVEVSVEIEQ